MNLYRTSNTKWPELSASMNNSKCLSPKDNQAAFKAVAIKIDQL